MSNNHFRDVMGQIDDHLLARCEAYEQQLAKKKRIIMRGAITAAACFAMIIGALFILGNSRPKRTSLFTADDIAALFPQEGATLTGSESTLVYAPDESALGLISIPDTDSIPIYRCLNPNKPIGKAYIREFADGIFPALAEALSGTVPEYTVNSYTSRLDIDTTIGKHSITVSQYSYQNFFYICRIGQNGIMTQTILDDLVVQADQTKTDEEIIAGLSGVHNTLEEIFGVNFPDAKVVRVYDEKSIYGVIGLRVYFYDEDAHPLNKYSEVPVSDNIYLWFFNNPVFMSEECSKDRLQYVDIHYIDWRTDNTEMYQAIGTEELLPLHEAETLLKKGYSFGGYRRDNYNQSSIDVDFSDYDAVSFTYLWNNTPTLMLGEPVYCIPFYVFYKQIDTAENGNKVYAKTYVPAVYVSGLKEYFQKQQWDSWGT